MVGLLYGIGRKFGWRHMEHVYDGYTCMLALGCDEAAKVCLTHSFCIKKKEDYIGRMDVNIYQLKDILTYGNFNRTYYVCTGA